MKPKTLTFTHTSYLCGWVERSIIEIVQISIFLCPHRNFGRHVSPTSCPVHISYILWGKNSKFGVWMHLGVAECHTPFLGHLDLWPSFKTYCVRSISLIFFEVGIPNLVCGSISGWQSVMYRFCDLDLVSRIIVSGASHIYYFREESQICCMDTSLDADVSHTIFRSLWSWPMT